MGSDQKPKFVSFVRTAPDPRRAIVAADPAPVEIDLARTALLVVDMQNDFLHDDGWFAASGIDPAPVRRAIGPVKAMLLDLDICAAREKILDLLDHARGISTLRPAIEAFARDHGIPI